MDDCIKEFNVNVMINPYSNSNARLTNSDGKWVPVARLPKAPFWQNIAHRWLFVHTYIVMCVRKYHANIPATQGQCHKCWCSGSSCLLLRSKSTINFHPCWHQSFDQYRQVSNIRRTLVGNKIVDHSDVVGASPVGAVPITSSFST